MTKSKLYAANKQAFYVSDTIAETFAREWAAKDEEITRLRAELADARRKALEEAVKAIECECPAKFDPWAPCGGPVCAAELVPLIRALAERAP